MIVTCDGRSFRKRNYSRSFETVWNPTDAERPIKNIWKHKRKLASCPVRISLLVRHRCLQHGICVSLYFGEPRTHGPNFTTSLLKYGSLWSLPSVIAHVTLRVNRKITFRILQPRCWNGGLDWSLPFDNSRRVQCCRLVWNLPSTDTSLLRVYRWLS